MMLNDKGCGIIAFILVLLVVFISFYLTYRNAPKKTIIFNRVNKDLVMDKRKKSIRQGDTIYKITLVVDKRKFDTVKIGDIYDK